MVCLTTGDFFEREKTKPPEKSLQQRRWSRVLEKQTERSGCLQGGGGAAQICPGLGDGATTAAAEVGREADGTDGLVDEHHLPGGGPPWRERGSLKRGRGGATYRPKRKIAWKENTKKKKRV